MLGSMKHTFSADEDALRTPEGALDLLAGDVTRSQRLVLKRAVDAWFVIRDEPSSYPDALHVAAQLKAMRADTPILVAALFGTDSSTRHYDEDYLREHFGQECVTLVSGVRWLNEMSIKDSDLVGAVDTRDQAERLRRMVLSLVEDIRVVLVKLAYRTQRLYKVVKSNDPRREALAEETLAVYAPLANRLGLGQLKWELEDVAFRIVNPDAYKRIASSLEENRAARESYIVDFVANLDQRLVDGGITNAEVIGRPKHIHSIWKKMRAKHIEFTDLFDVRAVRVLVDDLQQCYGALGVAHGCWQPIAREFDDYIANPKDNGYRSLHTAVIGPGGKPVEIQIRTRSMDDDAENGVAAHWAYKEGSPVDEALQKNINALRHLLEDSDDDQLIEGFNQQLDADRVYVFTPKGEVIDLVGGSTPLDFAYHIHSEIGHRCRGAKINGSIVPLTRALGTGDRVEILTTRDPAPSRDWLNRSLGYLASSRARGKVRAWFNARDHDQHVADGRAVLERELKRLKATSISIDKLVRRLKFDKPDGLFVAIGRNDVTIAQIAGAIEHLSEPVTKLPVVNARPMHESRSGHTSPHARQRGDDGIRVRGVGNLLTTVAACCQPVPWDDIVGFITRGKGVSIHRADCVNMINLGDADRSRLIEVDWGADSDREHSRYQVEVRIEAYDRQGLLRDVSTVLANQNIDVVAVNTLSDPDQQTADMRLTVQIANMGELATLMERIRQLRNVSAVERVV